MGEQARHLKLDAYHEGVEGRVDHQTATLALGPPRRFTFYWVEDTWETWFVAHENEDGTFRGTFEYRRKHTGQRWPPDRAIVSVGNTGPDSWEITTSGKMPDEDAPYTFSIFASVLETGE